MISGSSGRPHACCDPEGKQMATPWARSTLQQCGVGSYLIESHHQPQPDVKVLFISEKYISILFKLMLFGVYLYARNPNPN